jgi:hypothetical protein
MPAINHGAPITLAINRAALGGSTAKVVIPVGAGHARDQSHGVGLRTESLGGCSGGFDLDFVHSRLASRSFTNTAAARFHCHANSVIRDSTRA